MADRRWLFGLVVAVVLLAGCTDSVTATRAVEAMGLTNVEAHGYAWVGCDQSDSIKTRFTATNVRGEKVSGVVCAGLGPFAKKSTVRFD